ncbi:putative nuclease HARBI1 [Lytechinus variegatus]|uniref:putative nuclease HARBI1 n=1 Tax=Lytechinus variegatus TaxID=7654 RepID=UPI001BB2866B|nr:putative nuclease HARBI1 [Lytechinus variegatus]
MFGRCTSDLGGRWSAIPYLYIYVHPTWNGQFITMAAPRRLRMALLEHELAQARFQYNLVLAALLEEAERERQRAGRRIRRWWVREWILRRPRFGQYETLMRELEAEHAADFKSYLRMVPQMFYELLDRVGPRIAKTTTHRTPLDPGLKLAITLRFLATGSSYHDLAFAFRVPHNTISLFVPEVCQAIYDEYEDEMWATPQTEDEWRPIAEGFGDRWNFPHCCGAIDGKHVTIKKPPKSGSLYYNYKGFFSIVMLAVVNSDYKFIWADVGSPGSYSDAGIFNRSRLEPGLREGTIGLPQPDPLPNDDQDTPYYMVGDDAFPLRPYMMKPYPHRHLKRDERIYNYRCSRARRVVENAFGIFANRFRCLLTTLGLRPSKVTKIVKACMTLHNLMRTRYPNLQNADLDREDEQGQIIAGAWRDQAVLEDVQAAGHGPRLTRPGKELRAYLKNYFCSPAGSVPWQDVAINQQ